MDELKPCPFCGNEIELIPAHFENCWCINVPSIICTKCHQTYKGSDIMKLGKSEAENEVFSTNLLVKRWNHRPAEDAKDKEIEKLKSDLVIAYQETEKWKKMFYDLIDKQASVSTDPKVLVIESHPAESEGEDE